MTAAAAPGAGAAASPTALRDAALAAHRAGRLAEALGHYAAWLARAPKDAGAWTNLGALLRSQGRHDLALAAQERAFALDPRARGVRNNLANALNDVGHHDRSLALRRALMRETPDDPAQPAMAGKALRALGRLDEGTALLEEARARFPEDAELEIQLALTRLKAGDWAAGFRHYAARWRTGELKPRAVRAPKWDGGPLDGRTVLVLPEQGFGDALCFARFLPALREARPARVALLAEPPLARLMQGAEGADRVGPGAPPEGFDCYADMMDLPLLHFAREPAIPPPTRLTVPEDSRARARALTAPFRDRFRVGVVWTGSVTYRANAFRSLSHRDLHALLSVPGLQMLSLYKGPEIETFRADGTAALILDLGSQDRDFADCAALMEEMDLVLTTCTVTAHLAGSLGVPCWTLLHWDAFWLWGTAGETTPWYPSMRLWRQERPRDWAGVLARVRAALEPLARVRA
jgi:Flp pilus assembly protein TadD